MFSVWRPSILGLLALAGLAAVDTTTPFSVRPELLRVEVAPTAAMQRHLTLSSTNGTTLLAMTTECPCITMTTSTPVVIPAGQTTRVTLRITGALAGLKMVHLRTTTGSVAVPIHIHGAGLGSGTAELARAVAAAREAGGRPLVLIHNLRAGVKTCHCDAGLGGLGRVNALPMAWRAADGPAADFVLGGDADGGRPGTVQALAEVGWTTASPRLRTTQQPADDLTAFPGVLLLYDGVDAIQNRRVVRPLLDGGMIAQVLILNADGTPVRELLIPLDDSLPSGM